MKCYYHNDKDAVGQCSECGKGLCPDCIDLYNPPLCSGCAKKLVMDEKSNVYLKFILTIAFMVGGYLFSRNVVHESGIYNNLTTAVIIGGIPCGWMFINNHRKYYLSSGPIILMFLYLLVKLLISCAIGWAVLICTIIYGIIKLIILNKKKKNITQNENDLTN